MQYWVWIFFCNLSLPLKGSNWISRARFSRSVNRRGRLSRARFSRGKFFKVLFHAVYFIVVQWMRRGIPLRLCDLTWKLLDFFWGKCVTGGFNPKAFWILLGKMHHGMHHGSFWPKSLWNIFRENVSRPACYLFSFFHSLSHVLCLNKKSFTCIILKWN